MEIFPIQWSLMHWDTKFATSYLPSKCLSREISLAFSPAIMGTLSYCTYIKYTCMRIVDCWYYCILYGGKVWWGESLANWLVSSIWWKKIWRINRSANRLLIVSTNLDGFSLANHGRFTKFANVSPHQSFPPYSIGLKQIIKCSD